MPQLPFTGDPTTLESLRLAVDAERVLSPGGIVGLYTAKHALLIGDAVYVGHDLSAAKGLETSIYQRNQLGIVVGGYRTDFDMIADVGAIGISAALTAEPVLVMTRGITYGVVDATGILKGAPLTAGRTTAGRVRGDMVVSYAETTAGLAIKAGASALVKAVNAVRTIVAGVAGTATAAALDMAALAGTVVNGTHNVFVFRVAANGTSVTSAMGTAGATRDAIVFPAGSASLVTLGWVFINPTGVGNFVGGTTALDDATVIPNAVYVDAVGLGCPIGTALQDGGAAATAVLMAVGTL